MIIIICFEIYVCIYVNWINKGNFYIIMLLLNLMNYILIKGGNL